MAAAAAGLQVTNHQGSNWVMNVSTNLSGRHVNIKDFVVSSNVVKLILPLTNSMHTQLNEKSHEEKEKPPRRMSGLNLSVGVLQENNHFSFRPVHGLKRRCSRPRRSRILPMV